MESERGNQKPLHSSISKPREEMNAQYLKQFPSKSSTPNSKVANALFGAFHVENDSASLGDINEINDFSVRKNTKHIGLRLRGDSVDLSRCHLYELASKDLEYNKIITLDLRSNKLVKMHALSNPN